MLREKNRRDMPHTFRNMIRGYRYTRTKRHATFDWLSLSRPVCEWEFILRLFSACEGG